MAMNVSTTASRDIGDPYENLANAIIVSAVNDYRATLKAFKITGDFRTGKKASLADVESFFFSPWFRILTKMDGEFLVNALRKEVLGDEYKTVFESGKRT